MDDLLKKLQGIDSVEEVVAIVKEAGKNIDPKQAQELIKHLSSAIPKDLDLGRLTGGLGELFQGKGMDLSKFFK